MLIELECPVCEGKYKRYPSQLKKIKHTSCCSPKCSYKARSLGLVKRIVEKRYKSKPITRFEKECPICNNIFTTIPSRIADGRGKYCSRECFERAHKDNMKGDKNPSWIDGRSYNKRCYRGDDWDKIRMKAYKRDKYICQTCGIKCIGRRDMKKDNSNKLIQCHHINGDKKDNRLENLQTLCVVCHGKNNPR